MGRRERSALLASEVILQDRFAVVLGNNQVDARPPKICVKRQIRVGNRIRSRVRRANDVGLPRGMCTQAIARNKTDEDLHLARNRGAVQVDTVMSIRALNQDLLDDIQREAAGDSAGGGVRDRLSRDGSRTAPHVCDSVPMDR